MTALMNRRAILVSLIGILIICDVSIAQIELPVTDVFSFEVVKKTPAHPFYGKGGDMGFRVNGVEGDTLVFIRDSTYALHFGTLPTEQFPYSYTDPAGGSLNRYRRMRIGDFFEKKYIYWRADEETPDVLYYGSFEYLFMGGTILVVDSLVSSVDESTPLTVAPRLLSRISPNPIRESGMISFVPSQSADVQIQIIDVLGRVVRQTTYSVNENTEARISIDRGELRTGIYFYRVIASDSYSDVVTSGSFHVQ